MLISIAFYCLIRNLPASHPILPKARKVLSDGGQIDMDNHWGQFTNHANVILAAPGWSNHLSEFSCAGQNAFFKQQYIKGKG